MEVVLPMKKLLPSLLLSFFSFPLGDLLRFIYFHILPSYGSAEIALLSIVISLNVISLIYALYILTTTKKSN